MHISFLTTSRLLRTDHSIRHTVKSKIPDNPTPDPIKSANLAATY